jgi:carbon monoxide dehydrogenase subunit G
VELTHEFTVPASVEDAWATFNDLERIAPCFPGASLTSYDGQDFEGLVKVKLGPISLQYNGTGRFVERDEAAHRAVIEAKGKDKRGNGTAAANVTAVLEAAGEGQTNVKVSTDLNITGKPAQFGRGVMQDVSDKLLGQFATCLEQKLGQPAEEPPSSAEESPSSAEESPSPAEESASPAEESPSPATGSPSRAKKSPSPTKESPSPTKESASPATAGAQARQRAETTAARLSAEPASGSAELDLGMTVLPVLIKRYARYIVGGLIAFWLLKKILSR